MVRLNATMIMVTIIPELIPLSGDIHPLWQTAIPTVALAGQPDPTPQGIIVTVMLVQH
jgi:hypothetical protein